MAPHVVPFLTTESNGVVEPIHNKAMSVMLMTAADVERWLTGTVEKALQLQKPSPDEAIVLQSAEKKAASMLAMPGIV